ncbi:MAG TPA: glycosyltransferase family 4 protein [Cyclobacteriaceae bacterium]|nr:glycosyltransferase family 4 protein [Cyclobacteriaceae bacterium]
MRILLVHNKYKLAGGEDNVFNAESELLERHGHEVEQILFDNSVIRTFLDKCLSGLKVFYNPTSARVIERKIESFKPDVIHVHNFIPLISPSIFYVANRYRIPVILTLHNFRLICPSATLYHNNAVYENSLQSYFPFDAIVKGVYRNSVFETAMLALTIQLHHLIGTWKTKVDFYIALTSFAKDKFVSAKVPLPADKILIKPNSVQDCGMGTARRRDHFLFVGRLVEEKGLRTLLEATWKSPFKLIIIGDGPMQQEVIEHTKKNPNVVYLGPQNKATVISHMKACAGLIFPSLWYEGLPLTLIEAFSAGTPVIASRLGAMKELIQDGVNGLLFESGNEKELVRCIETIQNEKIDVDLMSQRGRATYLRYFTPERNYNLLLTIYNRAIAMKHALPGKWNNKLIHEMKGVTS